MIRHILFITFTDNILPEQIYVVRRAFLQMPLHVEGVTGVEWGMNDSPENKNAGFTHCMLMTFYDAESRQRYLSHPAHDKLKKIFTPFIRDIVVLDFTVETSLSINISESL